MKHDFFLKNIPTSVILYKSQMLAVLWAWNTVWTHYVLPGYRELLVIDGVVIFREDFLDPQPIIFIRVGLFPPGHRICTNSKHCNHLKQLQVEFSRFWLKESTVDGSLFEHGS